MPRFVPSDEDRALVKLLIANGFAQHVVCQYISNRRGSHISESTLKHVFAHELKVGKAELVTKVLTQFMAAIMRGERWAICKYIDQQMWRPEWGGWRARPYEVSLGGAQSAASSGSDLPPLQLMFSSSNPIRLCGQACLDTESPGMEVFTGKQLVFRNPSGYPSRVMPRTSAPSSGTGQPSARVPEANRVFAGRAEIGAAWSKRSSEGRDYLSVKLDDPSFNTPIYANLFDDEGGETFSLIWSRGRKQNGD